MNYKKFYKENKQLLIGLFILAILAFGFFGTNLILNIDGINDFPMNDMAQGYKTHLAMGRWGWALMSTIFSYMPIPFFLVIVNCLLLTISAVYINKIFKIQNKIYQFIVGAILICFPYAANIFCYLQWHFIYGIGVFIIIYGLYRLQTSKNIIDVIIPIFLFTIAISFYQAFIAVIATFLVTLVLLEIIEKETFKALIFKIGKYILVIILSCLIYMLITNTLINVFNIEPVEYQNSKNMFNFSLINFSTSIHSILINFCSFFRNQLSFPIFLKIFFYIILLFSLILNIFEIKRKDIPLYLLGVIFLLFAPRILEFPDPTRWFHDITLLGYMALFTTGVGLLVKFIELYADYNIIKKISLIIFIPIIFILVITINKAGVLAQMTSTASLNFINRLQMRVETIEGYSNLPSLKKYYIPDYLGVDYFPYNRDLYPYAIGITSSFIMNEKDIVDAIRVLGIDATTASDKITKQTRKEINNIIRSNEKCYPENESIFIYEDIIVVNFCL